MVTHRGLPAPKQLRVSRANQFSNNQTEIDSVQPNNRRSQASKQSIFCIRNSTHAQRHMHTLLHMLKPLSQCLLSHYSGACYFLKQEKAIYPQRSAERFATRLSPGIWEVNLKFEECGLKPKEYRKWSSSGLEKLLSQSLKALAAAKAASDVRWERVLQTLLMTAQKSFCPPMGSRGTNIVLELWHIHAGSQTSGFHFPPLPGQWMLAVELFTEIVSSTSCAISLA